MFRFRKERDCEIHSHLCTLQGKYIWFFFEDMGGSSILGCEKGDTSYRTTQEPISRTASYAE